MSSDEVRIQGRATQVLTVTRDEVSRVYLTLPTVTCRFGAWWSSSLNSRCGVVSSVRPAGFCERSLNPAGRSPLRRPITAKAPFERAGVIAGAAR
jgi:hypothetical protein